MVPFRVKGRVSTCTNPLRTQSFTQDLAVGIRSRAWKFLWSSNFCKLSNRIAAGVAQEPKSLGVGDHGLQTLLQKDSCATAGSPNGEHVYIENRNVRFQRYLCRRCTRRNHFSLQQNFVPCGPLARGIQRRARIWQTVAGLRSVSAYKKTSSWTCLQLL